MLKLLKFSSVFRKGQSAIEFIALVGAVSFFFLAFLFVLNMNLADKTWENRNLMTKEVALTVQNEIGAASKSIDGYRREFNIPLYVVDLDYDINITNGFVYIITVDGQHALALLVANTTGNIMKGENVIRKNNGMVFLNQ